MRQLKTAGLGGLLAAGFLALTPAPQMAQSTPEEKMLPAGKLKLAGRSMRCGGTPTLISHTFWDYGGAKKGVIILNPSKLDGLPNSVRLYVYAHECGHQLFGPKEIKADCYSVERGKREGWLTRTGMNEICTFLAPHRGDWVHPPGPQRCEIMNKCFDKAKPRSASR